MPSTKDILTEAWDAVERHPWHGEGEVSRWHLEQVANTALNAWDGEGWYQVGTGRTTWDLADDYDVCDVTDLAAQMYVDMEHAGASPRDVWAVRITEPDVIAELEAEWE